MSTAELVRHVQAGRTHYFDALYEGSKRRIFSLCLRMTGDYALAEELTQEAFILAFRKIDTFRGDSAFGTWIHRIAVNLVLMHARQVKSRGYHSSLDEVAGDEDGAASEKFGSDDRRLTSCIDRVALTNAINQLAPGYRIVLVLHDIEGYEHREIAEMLGCTAGNTKSQLHKARLRLREMLTRQSNASNDASDRQVQRQAA